MIEDVLAEQEVTVDQQTAVSLMFLSIQPDDMPHAAAPPPKEVWNGVLTP